MKTLLGILKWGIAPLDDRLRGLSLTRLLAIACFVFVAHGAIQHEQGLSWVDFWVLTLGICTAYGKKVLLAFLQRVGLKSASMDITNKTQIEIAQRRADGAVWDAEAS